MKLLLFLTAFFSSILLIAQNPDAEVLKKKMTAIRQSTNWSNKDEANKANEEIRQLSRQLMMLKNQSGQTTNGNTGEPQPGQMTEENVDFKMKLWEQIWASALAGEDADIDLAKPLREEIVEEYKEDESPEVKNPVFLDEMTFLCIDMSMPGVEMTINQMDRYKSVKYLIITGGTSGSPVDLNDLLNRATHYPLETLYIINFRHFVTTIPESINKFANLSHIGLFNNQINVLPEGIGSLQKLDSLYVDVNPLQSLFPGISKCLNLKTLGIAQTKISDAEIEELKNLLPECNILQE